MGWETLAFAGFQAFGASQSIKAANKSAQGIAAEGSIAAQNSADNTIRRTGALTTSFLQSGITLEGGPMDILKQAFNSGRTDIDRIRTNSNNASKNIVSAARTKAIQGLATSAAAMGTSPISEFGDGFTDAYNNVSTYQTGATPGLTSNWSAPWQANAALPWSA